MKQLRNAMTFMLNGLAGVSFLAMVILTCWQVFTRYLLQTPSCWSERLVSYLLAWVTFSGASLVTGERGHMNIPALVERMPEGMKKMFSIFAELIAFAFAAVILVFGGVQITSLAMGQMTSSLRVAIGIFYIVLPLSGVLNMIYTAINIYDIVKGNIPVLPSAEEDSNAQKTEKEEK